MAKQKKTIFAELTDEPTIGVVETSSPELTEEAVPEKVKPEVEIYPTAYASLKGFLVEYADEVSIKLSNGTVIYAEKDRLKLA